MLTAQHWVVTGGLGFIGSAFVRMVLHELPDIRITVLDAMTYAANSENLLSVRDNPRYSFVRGDIRNPNDIDLAVGSGAQYLLNFAAETHVDRSITDPAVFVSTNVVGTQVLLEAVHRHAIERYLQVSTDEVYGDVAMGSSTEYDRVCPRSPYAASKASGDLHVLAYRETYGTPVLITRGSNTYGQYQYPEKLIPRFITRLLSGQTVPLMGDSLQTRDWLYVDDHCRGILRVLTTGILGEIYNIGGGNHRTNSEITQAILDTLELNWDDRVQMVADRLGGDRRYSIDSSKAAGLGWKPVEPFAEMLKETISWYQKHPEWWGPLLVKEMALV